MVLGHALIKKAKLDKKKREKQNKIKSYILGFSLCESVKGCNWAFNFTSTLSYLGFFQWTEKDKS